VEIVKASFGPSAETVAKLLEGFGLSVAAARLDIEVTDDPADAVPLAASARQKFGTGSHRLTWGD
jgi:hypothetical protein